MQNILGVLGQLRVDHMVSKRQRYKGSWNSFQIDHDIISHQSNTILRPPSFTNQQSALICTNKPLTRPSKHVLNDAKLQSLNEPSWPGPVKTTHSSLWTVTRYVLYVNGQFNLGKRSIGQRVSRAFSGALGMHPSIAVLTKYPVSFSFTWG
jgi:hypothetical protein